jgi:hypothetical protein
VQNACSDHSSHLVEQDTGGEKSTPMELNTQQHTQQQQAAIAHGLLNANHHYVTLHFDCKRSCAYWSRHQQKHTPQKRGLTGGGVPHRWRSANTSPPSPSPRPPPPPSLPPPLLLLLLIRHSAP